MESFFSWLTSIVGAGPAHMEQVWDYRAGHDPSLTCNLGCYRQAEEITALTCSSEAQLMTLTGEGRDIHIWNVRTRYAVFIYRETMSAVLDWLPDASLKISTSTDRVFYIWDVWTQAQKQPGVGVYYSPGSAS
ncbi:hypothetical protein [Dictyobacter aurantiacus]|uniref:Uncharacterized protein n=1 Tax=Dictyobacter aurantiacus TaxID=1936993 RepID=A0A401ZAW0_9CHLR|nr:hypothetical protein [Dictyobacter aurantiacus]GCE04007.1 hypothetical protein KDAU_13360 [Dictyobacter aurantiacus]